MRFGAGTALFPRARMRGQGCPRSNIQVAAVLLLLFAACHAIVSEGGSLWFDQSVRASGAHLFCRGLIPILKLAIGAKPLML